MPSRHDTIGQGELSFPYLPLSMQILLSKSRRAIGYRDARTGAKQGCDPRSSSEDELEAPRENHVTISDSIHVSYALDVVFEQHEQFDFHS